MTHLVDIMSPWIIIYDEGNICITSKNLYSVSPLIFKNGHNNCYTLIQIFCLKKSKIGKLFSWENSNFHPNEPKENLNPNTIITKQSKLNRGYNIIYVKLRKDVNDKYLLESPDIYQKFRFKNDFNKLNSDKYIHNTNWELFTTRQL